MCVTGVAVALASQSVGQDLFDLSFEELLEIKITTRRFEESYIEVPRSISLVNESDLEDGSFRNLTEAVGRLSNVSIRNSFGRWEEKRVIRSVANVVGEDVVGVLVDGMPMTDFSPGASLHDLERVEVLRGSDVALYGRGAFAGAINLVSRKPKEGERGRFSVGIDDEGGFDVSGFHDFDFGASFDLLLSGRSFESEQGFDNTLGTGGGMLGGESSEELSLSGRIDASDRLTITFRSMHQDIVDGAIPIYLQNSSFNNCFLDSGPQYYCGVLETPDEVGANLGTVYYEPGFERQVGMHHLGARWDTGGPVVEFKAALQDQTFDVGLDGDLYELDSVYYVRNGDIDESSVEGVVTWALRDTDRLIVGLSDYRRDSGFSQVQTFNAFGASTVAEQAYTGSEVQNTALFGSYDFQVGDESYLTLDLRFARDEIGYVVSEHGGQRSWDSWAPSVNFRRSIGANGLAYASVSIAKKPGGFNVDLVGVDYFSSEDEDAALQFFTFDEESLSTLEVGFRNHAFGETLWWDLSLYKSVWDDLQLSQSLTYRDVTGGERRVSTIVNGGQADLLGGEFDGWFNVTENLEISFGIGYSYSKLKDTHTTAHEDLTGSSDVSGNRVGNTAEFDGNLALRYSRELSNGWEFYAKPIFIYEGERFVAEHNFAQLEDVERFDLTLGIRTDVWSVSLWGKNLNDDNALESASRFGDAATFFARRAFGLDLPEQRRIGATFSLNY